MKKIATIVALSGALFASQADYGWELTPTIGGTIPQSKIGTLDNYTGGIRVGKNLQNFFLDQVELGFDFSNDTKFKNSDKTSDVYRYYINGVKDLVNFTSNLKLYGLLGVGYEDWAHPYNKAKDGGLGQVGLGLKYYVTDNFALRAEARDSIKFDHGYNTIFYTLGFAADFGKRNVDMKPVAVAQEPQETIVNFVEVIDDDQDGVPNNIDKCPGTPKGVVVDENGCEKVIHISLGVNFAFDSAKVTAEYIKEIKVVADFMKNHPDYKVLLDGYTDSTGPAAYNLKLSIKRAKAVAKALEGFGVPSDKITTKGFGEADPVASNATKEGRAKNRRVDAKFRD